MLLPCTAPLLAALGLLSAQDAPSAPKAEDAPPALSGSADLGLSSSYGNTELTTITLHSEAELSFGDDRVEGLFDWYYAEETDQTTNITTIDQRRVRGALQYDHFMSERAFAYGRVDGQGDEKQDLTLRFIGGAGGGYQFIDSDKAKLSGELGAAWNHEDFKGLAPDEFISARVALKYERQLCEDVGYVLDLEWLPSIEDKDDTTVFGRHGLHMQFGKGMVASLRHEFDFDNTPGIGKDRIDHRVIFGLGFKF